MTEIVWDKVGERLYETGVDHGVLYIPDNEGNYDLGVAWNGLTTVTESPSGAESTKQYADNIPYLNLKSAEEFGATIEAFTYPDEFAQCDGSAEPEPGVFLGQQGRRSFGFSYRSLIGNDTQGNDYGEKIHLVYGCDAAPSEKANTTVNDSPEATALSWEVTTIPVAVGTVNGVSYKPTSHIVIDSTKADADALADLKDILYGTVGADPRLPLPAEVYNLFSGAITEVSLATFANQPSYNGVTHVVTLPNVAGVQWKVDGEDAAPGAQPALGVGEVAHVTAVPLPGYTLSDDSDNDWNYAY